MDHVQLDYLLDRATGPNPSSSPGKEAVGSVLLALSWAVTSVPVLILVVYLIAVAALLVSCHQLAPRSSVAATILWTMLTIVSFSGTWSQMFKFLGWSFRNFGTAQAESGDTLWLLPSACPAATTSVVQTIQLWAGCQVNFLPLYVLRLHDWLRATRLFEQAWLTVVSTPTSWWWSTEICLFTVGIWPLFMHRVAKRYHLRGLWVYMLTGQLVAISVANNLVLRAAGAGAAARRTSSDKVQGRGKEAQSDHQDAPEGASLLEGRAWLVTCAAVPLGMAVVYAHPVELLSILVMHLGPVVLSLPLDVLSGSTQPIPTASRSITTRARTTYVGLALVSLVVRAQATLAVIQSSPSSIALHRALWETLWSHPARSSIGLDNVGITVSTPLWIAWELAGTTSVAMSAPLAGMSSVLLGPAATLALYLAVVPY